MPVLILIAFLALPLVEIALFIVVGEEIGFWPTLGLVVASAMAGFFMLRIQGFSTLRRLREVIEREQYPGAELFNAASVLIAGLLLIIPGFFTDAIGLVLFVPPLRTGLRALLFHHLTAAGGVFTKTAAHQDARGEAQNARGKAGVRGAGPMGAAELRRAFSAKSGISGIIDGEYEDITPQDETTGENGDGRGGENSGPRRDGQGGSGEKGGGGEGGEGGANERPKLPPRRC